MSSTEKRVVVITGASAGIGAATAAAFAKEGSRLVLHGRNETKLRAVADTCVGLGIAWADVAMVLGDLKDDSTVDDIVKTTLDRFGTIHVLYNNAGYVSDNEGPIHMNGSVEGLDDMYRINIRVPYMLTQAFIPELAKTKALAMKGIHVNSINSGCVHTDIIRRIGKDVIEQFLGEQAKLSPLEQKLATPEDMVNLFLSEQAKLSPLEQKLATPKDMANLVVFLASDKAASITGQNLFCDKALALAHPIVDCTQFA